MRLLPLIAISYFSIILPSIASPVEGLWQTQNKRSVIEIKKCDEGLCGHVYWVIKGGLKHDIHNPAPELQSRPICGLKIMWGFTQESEQKWGDGNIYKADEGDIYDAYVELLSDNQLKLRGYIGVSLLGKTQIWHRVSQDSIFDRCIPPKELHKTMESPHKKKGQPDRPALLKSE